MPSEPTFTIKPLEWQQTRDGDWTASTIFSLLQVEVRDDGDDRPPEWSFRYCVDEYYDEGKEPVESMEVGKQRAWEWYLERLMPALLPVPKKVSRK